MIHSEIQAYLKRKDLSFVEDLISQYGEVDKSTISDVLNHFTYRWDCDVHMDASCWSKLLFSTVWCASGGTK